MEQVDWVPALAMLAVGVAIGIVVIWRSSRVSRPAPPPETVDQVLDQRDAGARLDALIAQLRELEDLASERTPVQLAAERRSLEIEAARALRDLELRSEIPAATAVGRTEEAAAAPPPPASAFRGLIWGTVTVVAVAGLVFFVTRAASDRTAGESPTGGAMEGRPASAPMADLEALRGMVQRNPGNTAARVDLAQALLIARDFPGVLEQTQAVLKVDPDEPRALSYEAVVRVAQGEADRALEMAQRAVSLGGDNVETWVYLAIVRAQRGERAAAVTVLEQAVSRFPNDAPALQSLLGELRGTAPGAQPAPELQAPPGGVLVQVQLDPTAGMRGGTVFVFVRPAGGGGEPVAVRRSAAPAFPVAIGLLPGDSMTGSLPETMRIEARLDADGNPATVGPDDLTGVAEDVRAGGVARVVLKTP